MRYRISEIKTDQYYGVEYLDDYQGEGPRIGVWQGHARGGRELSGAALTPVAFLHSPHRAFFEKTKCEWFLPFVERMASGEILSIDEVRKAYKFNNEGKDLQVVE